MATAADVDSIARICSAGYRRTYPGLLNDATIEDVVARYYAVDRIRSEVEPAPPGWSGYLVAEDDEGRVAACGGGGLTEEGVGEVFVLYTDPDRRGRGFGTAVLDLLTRQQKDAGARVQWVSVQKGNALGIPFYRARGFVFVEEVLPWDGTGAAEGARTWRMRRSLSPERAAGARRLRTCAPPVRRVRCRTAQSLVECARTGATRRRVAPSARTRRQVRRNERGQDRRTSPSR